MKSTFNRKIMDTFVFSLKLRWRKTVLSSLLFTFQIDISNEVRQEQEIKFINLLKYDYQSDMMVHSNNPSTLGSRGLQDDNFKLNMTNLAAKLDPVSE